MAADIENSKFVKRLLVIFLCVVIFSAVVIKLNLDSVDNVSVKTERLVTAHIPDLQKIADLENLINRLTFNLHRYYANIDRKFYDINTKYIEETRSFIFANSALFEANTEHGLIEALDEFEKKSIEFDNEMLLGRERDWDKLREHLYESQDSSERIVNLLKLTSNTIRDNATQNSVDTLDEIKALNNIQLIFIIAILCILLFIILILRGRVKDQEKLYHLAYFDSNTDLPNKILFEQDFVEKYKLNNTQGHTLLLISLDRFNLITGRFGYLVGEELINKVSKWLQSTLTKQKTIFQIYQYSATSWLVLLNNLTDKDVAASLASQLLDISTQPIAMDNIEMSCSCSIGITIGDIKLNSTIDLIKQADAALKTATEEGGNCFKFYSEKMGQDIEQYVDIDNALRYAIEKNELELYYQPKIDTATNSVAGAEVLLRWSRNNEMIPPYIFIPIAERSGLILRIGNWVLMESCRQWVKWQKNGFEALPIAVNISANQFQDPGFPSYVKSVLAETGMQASMLELEITEEAAVERPEQIISIMQELKDIGVSIALDDFGTGYSSLSHLRRFPLDVIKIDQAFIRDMHTSSNNASIVKLIIELAKQLEFKVVAEGVELDEHYQQLKQWHCEHMQGYLFSKPIPLSAYTEMLKKITYSNSNNIEKIVSI